MERDKWEKIILELMEKMFESGTSYPLEQIWTKRERSKLSH